MTRARQFTPRGPLTPLAQTVLERLSTLLPAAADPRRAPAMAAYMRDQFPFLGVPGPQLKAAGREIFAGLPKPADADLRAVTLACWELAEREYQYVACAWLREHVAACDADFIGIARHLITTKPWWDTVDTLAAHTVGPLVRRHPELVAVMDEWIAGDELWLIRTALLHQLLFRAGTDADRLFRYCRLRAEHPDFFIRKAIGWSLREYAKTNPAAVRSFVDANAARLSGLSRREALKNLPAD